MIDPERTRAADEPIRKAVRGFVTARIGDDGLSDDADFFAEGRVNSLFAMELITFIEREFALTVEVADLSLDNFRSIAACSQFVARRADGGQP